MKRIEDLPEELQRIFQQVWYSIEPIDGQFPGGAYIAERFFLAGFDTAMATGGLPQRPKRTVKEFYYEDDDVYALSSDGQIYLYLSSLRCWSKLPDLPQD